MYRSLMFISKKSNVIDVLSMLSWNGERAQVIEDVVEFANFIVWEGEADRNQFCDVWNPSSIIIHVS